MSTADWESEFYPVTAGVAEAAAPRNDLGAVSLLDHCLQKWRGLLPVNLKKHDLTAQDMVMAVGGDSCALCVRFRTVGFGDMCSGCPLVEARGVQCFRPDAQNKISPYDQWLATRDPRPMLWLLLRARVMVDRRRGGNSFADGGKGLADGRTVAVPQGLLMELLEATEVVRSEAVSEAKTLTRYPFIVTARTACEAVAKFQVVAASAAEAEAQVFEKLNGPDGVRPLALPGTTFESHGRPVITRVEPVTPAAADKGKS